MITGKQLFDSRMAVRNITALWEDQDEFNKDSWEHYASTPSGKAEYVFNIEQIKPKKPLRVINKKVHAD